MNKKWNLGLWTSPYLNVSNFIADHKVEITPMKNPNFMIGQQLLPGTVKRYHEHKAGIWNYEQRYKTVTLSDETLIEC